MSATHTVSASDVYKRQIFSGYPNQPTIVPSNDYQAWQTAINTFSNPESVTINLFATPGIDWMNNTILVQETIDMIETQRTDSLYIIDSPNIEINTSIGDGGKADVDSSQQVADALVETGIDSSYACTYSPWIQMHDSQNNVNVYIPPTGEVVRALAYEACINSLYYVKILNESELIKYFGIIIRGSFSDSKVKILKNELL